MGKKNSDLSLVTIAMPNISIQHGDAIPEPGLSTVKLVECHKYLDKYVIMDSVAKKWYGMIHITNKSVVTKRGIYMVPLEGDMTYSMSITSDFIRSKLTWQSVSKILEELAASKRYKLFIARKPLKFF